VSGLRTRNVHHPDACKFREWACVHKCECKEERDEQTIAEGQKAFFTKHYGISCCIKTWKMSVVFIHSWAKINKSVIVTMSLKRLLLDIRYIIFQQMGHQRISSLRHVTGLLNVPKFIELENCPSNSPDPSSDIYWRGELCSRSCVVKRSETLIILSALR